MVSFATAVKNGYKNAFNFLGRATRAEYWWWVLFNYLVFMGAVGLGFLFAQIDTNNEALPPLIFGCVFFINFIPSLAVTVRRLHDTGRSAWELLWNLIPYVGDLIIFIYTLCSSGPDNKYGPNPHKKSDSVDSKNDVDILEGASQDTHIPNTHKDVNLSILDHRRYMSPCEDTCKESEVLETENVKSETITAIKTESITENHITLSVNDKVEDKKHTTLPKWIRNWDVKKYNRYFFQIYVLYHLVFLWFLVGGTYCRELVDIWAELDWYIPFQFIAPYVIYLGIRYFVEIKSKQVENEKK